MRGENIGDVSLGAKELDRRRQHFGAGAQSRRHVVEHHLHDVGHAGEHDHVASMNPGAIEMAFAMSSAPCGMRAMRRRAGVGSTPRFAKNA